MTEIHSSFIDNYLKISDSKNSLLCVGLDPAIPKQRDKNVMPDEDRISFMKKIIHEVSPYASTIKINRQYIIGLTTEQIIAINKLIHERGMISIVDHKLSDIGSTNASAIFWFREEGFDAFTFCPFAGNIEEATQEAHKNGLGIIVLTLMSNTEAVFQKNATIDGETLYLHIVKECNKHDADACVIGATGNVTPADLERIKQILSKNKLLLVPVIGAQGGDAQNIINLFGKNLIINVGRAIIYSENPAEKASFYQKQFNELLS